MSKAGAVRMNLLDRGIAVFSPQMAARRMFSRSVLSLYEGGRSTKFRRKSKDNSSSERLVVRDAATVRATVRDLERNYDLVDGALTTLVRNVVGPNGIMIEPTPRKNGEGKEYDSIDDDFARVLLDEFRLWAKRPEVTRTLSWAECQELACRSWLRDGDQFTQLVEGTVPGLRHGSAVPLSLELLEADVVPLDYEDSGKRISAGIQRNDWGQPLNYYVYKNHPGNGGWTSEGELKAVPAERFLHLAVRKRLSGLRGISLFASAIDRLLDIKDYESSERIAARIASRITAFIKRDKDVEWSLPADTGVHDRDFHMEAGQIFTDFLPGEELAIANPNRPNSLLGDFVMSMMRSASRAFGLSYSSMSGNYDGTYSAQRQELVEAYDGYRMMTGKFVAGFVQPIWERFVQFAIASGRVKVPAHIRPETIAQATFRGPKMPWIDPNKEASAIKTLARGGIQSVTESLGERGVRLQDSAELFKRERALYDEMGLVFDTDPRHVTASGASQADSSPDADPADDKGHARAARSRPARGTSSTGANA